MIPNKNAKSLVERRWRVVITWKDNPNKSMRWVASKCGETDVFVSRWVTRFQETGGVNSMKSSGRPRKISDDDLQIVKRIAVDNKCGSRAIAAVLKSENGLTVCEGTIRRALHAMGGRYAACPRRQSISKTAMQKRLQWCRLYRSTSFRGVFFTDSTYVTLCNTKASPRQQVWLFEGEEQCEVVKPRSKQLHIYAGCCFFGKSRLYFATGSSEQKSSYLDPKTKQPRHGVWAGEYQDICRSSLIPDAKRIFGASPKYCANFVFQQDGAKPHKAKSTINMFQTEFGGQGVKLMEDWPPSSPDLSPIENAWAEMKRLVMEKGPLRSLEELKRAVIEAWDSIPNDFFENTVNGMNKRLKDCIKAKGGRF